MARFAFLAMLTGFAAILPPSAWGHAIVVSSRPAVGAIVPPGDLAIRLEFSSRIDRERSRVIVHGPDGSDSRVALAADAPPNVLAGRVGVTVAGRWKLEWQVLSVDGHITRGEVAFSVREKASAP
jgi:methionine-rich copper-binding protein CopC